MPRLLFVAGFLLFGEGSLIGYLLIPALLMGVMAAVWVFMLRRLGVSSWVIVLSLGILLSPSQYENMLWGFRFSSIRSCCPWSLLSA